MTREQELSAAIEEAVLPSRDYRIFSALLRQRAEWKTATITAKFQPRSLADLARLSRMSKANLCRGLDHLESHGWIMRSRADKRGRGHRTTYQLTRGMSCDCLKQRPEAASDADRARRYRARRRAGQGPEVSQATVTREAESVSESRDEVSQNRVTKCLTSRDETPGQAQFSAKEGRNEGSRGGGEKRKESRQGATPEAWPDHDRTWLTSSTFPGSWSSWSQDTIGAGMNRSTDTSYRRAA